MSAHASCFLLTRFWEGHDETRLLFADLIETEDWLRYVPKKPNVPDPWPTGIRFEFEGEGVEDVPFQVFGWLVISDRMKVLIEEHRLTGIRFYPIQAVSKVKFPLPRYWYAHLILLDGAIDLERATYWKKKLSGFDDEIFFLAKAAFKRSAIEGWDFFRSSESPEPMFCSARFHDLALKHRCTGIGFRPVPVS